MERDPRVRARAMPLALTALMVLTSASLLACSGEPRPAPDASGDSVQRYVVEGILTQLPSAPGRELMIRHEAIPEFVGASGDTVGMNAMTMGFPVSDESLLKGFSAGDSILFTFEVRWGGERPLRLTAIEELPPGSVLEFGKVQPR